MTYKILAKFQGKEIETEVDADGTVKDILDSVGPKIKEDPNNLRIYYNNSTQNNDTDLMDIFDDPDNEDPIVVDIQHRHRPA